MELYKIKFNNFKDYSWILYEKTRRCQKLVKKEIDPSTIFYNNLKESP